MNTLLITAIYSIGLYCIYKVGKTKGFSEGISYLKKNAITRNFEYGTHICNATDCHTVCFEQEGELWVKEYSGSGNKLEGRTFMVCYCPYCGYQTGKSKLHGINGKRYL